MAWKTVTNMGAHPYNDMRIGVATRDKISTKMLANLDKEYARLKGKQKAAFLRDVYYKVA